jgi:hypothetical protein
MIVWHGVHDLGGVKMIFQPIYGGLRVLRDILSGEFLLPDFRVNIVKGMPIMGTPLVFYPRGWPYADLDVLAQADPFGSAVNVALLSADADYGLAFVLRRFQTDPFCSLIDGQSTLPLYAFTEMEICGWNEAFTKLVRGHYQELKSVAFWGLVRPGLMDMVRVLVHSKKCRFQATEMAQPAA